MSEMAMKYNAAKLVMLALTALALTGCAGKVHYPTYYTLLLAPSHAPRAGESDKLPAVGVRRFETSSYLRQGRIVYRENPEQIGFYDYRRWATDPGQIVTTGMIESLRSSRLFSRVEAYDGQDRAPYLFHGRLEQLDEIDYTKGVQVEVRLSAQVLNTRTGVVVWAGETRKTSTVDGREMTAVVRAMSQATQDGLEQLVQDMRGQLLAMNVAVTTSPVSGAQNPR